jgi:CheY-like chemotaxis protein
MSPAQIRIVIADDNRDAARMLARLLSLNHYSVTAVVHDGQSAIDAIRHERPNVALLDIGMPGMSGLEVAKQIRNEPSPPLLVAVTGWGSQQDKQQALDAGFDEHLCKPVQWEQLAAILDRAAAK